MDENKYRDLCNIKTLYSNKKGFFEDYIENMTNIVGEEWIDKQFFEVHTDHDRILSCFNHQQLSKALQLVFENVQEVFREKSDSAAYQKLQDARNHTKSGDLAAALLLVNQALVRAKHGGKMYLESLLLRILISMKMNCYLDAIHDLQHCLKEKLQPEQKLTVYRNMFICYVELKDFKRASLTMNVLTQMADDDDERSNMENILTKIKGREIKEILPPNDFADEKLPKISNSLEIQQSDSAGRFMTAKKEISSGETLVVEEPIASCLLTEKAGTNCHNCLIRLARTPLSCNTCSTTVFCGTSCQKIALKSYHRYECKFMDLLIGSGISILSLTALRIITQNSLRYFNGFDKPQHPFAQIYSMESHEKTRKARDHFQRVLTSLFLLFILKKSGYFAPSEESYKDLVLNEDELLIAQVLLKSLKALQFNAHEIYETIFKNKHHFPSAKINYVGVGIYPTVSLFNHDCYPAVTRYFNGRNIIVKSLRPLKVKEVVAENYGYVFNRMQSMERQKLLSARYWFQCKCQACEEDWPSMAGLEKYPMRIRCVNGSCKKYVISLTTLQVAKKSDNKKCLSCQCLNDLNNIRKKITNLNTLFYEGIDLMNMGHFEEAVELLKMFSDQIHNLMMPPYKLMSLAHEALRNCWSLAGNTWLIPENYVKSS